MCYTETTLLHNELLLTLNPTLSNALHGGDHIRVNNLLSILLNVQPITNPHEWPLGSEAHRCASEYFEHQVQKVKEVEQDLEDEIMRCQKSNHCKRDYDGARAVSDSLDLSTAGPEQGFFQFPLPLKLSGQNIKLLYDVQEKRGKTADAKAMLETAPKSYKMPTRGGNWAAVFAFNRLVDSTTGSTIQREKASAPASSVTNKTWAKLDSVPHACIAGGPEFEKGITGEAHDIGQATKTCSSEQEKEAGQDENHNYEDGEDDDHNDTTSPFETTSDPSTPPTPTSTTPSPPTTPTSQHLPVCPQPPSTPRIKRIMTKRIPTEAVTHTIKRVPLDQLHLRRPLGELEIIKKESGDAKGEGS